MLITACNMYANIMNTCKQFAKLPPVLACIAACQDTRRSQIRAFRCTAQGARLQLRGHGAVHEQHGVVRKLVLQAEARRAGEHAAHQLHAPLPVHEPHVLRITQQGTSVSGRGARLRWPVSALPALHAKLCFH